jgi:anti-sigma-K factor RskA
VSEAGDRTGQDRFIHDDAPYVLGLLSAEERAAFEDHLAGCAGCAARIAEIADLPGLLATVPFDEVVEDVPDTLLPGLLRRAGLERRRRNWLTAGLAGVAAACLIALAIAVWPSGPTSPAPHPRAMSALVASPVRATAALIDKGWGTEIDLICQYDSSTPPGGYAYGLSVTDTSGATTSLGSWTIVPGKDITFASGTALRRDQIASVQITAGETPILQLRTG